MGEDEELFEGAGQADEQAWDEFVVRLGARMAEMSDADVLLIGPDVAEPGSAPYAHIACRNDLLLVDVAGRVFEIESAGAGSFARVLVHLLRDLHEPLHPVFLSADGLERPPNAEVLAEPAGAELDDIRPAVMPRSRQHLTALVEAALATFTDAPRQDEEGDFPVRTGGSVLFVRPLENLPAVDLFAEVVCDVRDVRRALDEVGHLNRRNALLTFHVAERTVHLQVRYVASPFQADQFATQVQSVLDCLDDIARDLAPRVDGIRFLEERGDDGVPLAEPEMPTLHAAMRTLLELELDEPGSVDAELAADIFGLDRALLLEYVEAQEAERAGWEKAAVLAHRSGNERETQVCRCEAAMAERRAVLLRKALRVTVDRSAGRHGERPTATRPPEPTRTRQLTLLPDPDLDPGQPTIDQLEGWA